jgi:hypothetical protein
VHSLQSAYGRFHWPDPRTWPAEVVNLYRSVTEPRSLTDLFIFNIDEDTSALYLEDAITALTVIAIPQCEWWTDRGYPSIVFYRSKLQQYTQRLQAAGFAIQIVESPAHPVEKESGVINIATVRNSMHRKRRRWA